MTLKGLTSNSFIIFEGFLSDEPQSQSLVFEYTEPEPDAECIEEEQDTNIVPANKIANNLETFILISFII